MAETFQVTTAGRAGLDEARAVFSDIHWRTDSTGQAHIFDEKKDEFVPVNEGDYIVHIGDRYEVSSRKPAKAKEAEAPEDVETTDSVPEAKEATPPADPEHDEAEVASTPNGATSFE